MKREGWKLGYYTDTITSHDDAYTKARQFFKDVIELCSEKSSSGGGGSGGGSGGGGDGRASLKWDMRLSDWDKGSNTPCVKRGKNRKQTNSSDSGSSLNQQSKDSESSAGIGGSGSPEDWPVLRCRAYLGLAIMDQEGQGKVMMR